MSFNDLAITKPSPAVKAGEDKNATPPKPETPPSEVPAPPVTPEAEPEKASAKVAGDQTARA
jgi:hypothetical protein